MKKTKFFFIMTVLILLDQISKYFIAINKAKLPISIIKNILQFTYCENTGIAFGIGNGNVILIGIFSIFIILGILVILYNKYSQIDRKLLVSISIMLAGGISNLLDRSLRLYVIDFIDLNKLIKFPIFNFADICIVIGAVLTGFRYICIDRGGKVEEDNS